MQAWLCSRLITAFLYQATECHTDLIIDIEGVALDAEVPVGLQGAEVQAQRAVVASRH